MMNKRTEDNSCRPASGETYLVIGQDLFSIEEYVSAQYNYSLHMDRIEPISSYAPAASMVYTDLESLRGLDMPTDYGSGIEYADGIFDSLFPNTGVGLQIGLWLNGIDGCDEINSGKLDQQISTLGNYVFKCKASVVFLRIGYEFDNPFFGYSNPKAYILAYQRLVNKLRAQLSTPELQKKLKFVWHSWAAPRSAGLTLQDYYPGDDFVDWVGISIFQQVFPWPSHWGDGVNDWGGSIKDIEEVLEFASRHNKPTMIAESTPFGGINLNTSEVSMYNETDPWDRWFGEVIKLIEKHDISMWCYINCDWEAQKMWHNVGFGDTRLSSNQNVMDKWQHYVVNSSGNQTFLMNGSMEKCTEHDISFGTNEYAARNAFLCLLVLSAAIGFVKMKIASRWSSRTEETQQLTNTFHGK